MLKFRLEVLDLSLLRKKLNTPFSVPPEGVCIKLGCLDIKTLIIAKLINYLHYLVKQDKNNMLYKFYDTQWSYRCTNDWTWHFKSDLADFNITENLDQLKAKPVGSFKRLVTIKAREYAFYKYLDRDLSKLDRLFYKELKLQD